MMMMERELVRRDGWWKGIEKEGRGGGKKGVEEGVRVIRLETCGVRGLMLDFRFVQNKRHHIKINDGVMFQHGIKEK